MKYVISLDKRVFYFEMVEQRKTYTRKALCGIRMSQQIMRISYNPGITVILRYYY